MNEKKMWKQVRQLLYSKVSVRPDKEHFFPLSLDFGTADC